MMSALREARALRHVYGYAAGPPGNGIVTYVAEEAIDYLFLTGSLQPEVRLWPMLSKKQLEEPSEQ
jgi:hypothetical protein